MLLLSSFDCCRHPTCIIIIIVVIIIPHSLSSSSSPKHTHTFHTHHPPTLPPPLKTTTFNIPPPPHTSPTTPGLKADKAAEVELFPAFKGGESLGTTTNNGEHTEDGQFSALLGDWKAPEVVVRAPPAESATESSAGGVDAATQPPKYVEGVVFFWGGERVRGIVGLCFWRGGRGVLCVWEWTCGCTCMCVCV